MKDKENTELEKNDRLYAEIPRQTVRQFKYVKAGIIAFSTKPRLF